MKENGKALVLLVLLAAFALYCQYRTRALCREVLSHVSAAEEAGDREDRPAAAREAQTAQKIWQSAEPLTKLYQGHAHIERIRDGLVALREACGEENKQALHLQAEALSRELNDLMEMDSLHWQSLL